MQIATFGAGCFWGIEEAFSKVKGVTETKVGYAGGWTKKPTYMKVCTGLTGHAEVVQVTFDPKIVSYKEILEVFWKVHDPTQKNRQGWDVGSQYRSAIFFNSKEQEKEAIKSKENQEKKLEKQIATKIEPAYEFFEAEEYHQKYFEKH